MDTKVNELLGGQGTKKPRNVVVVGVDVVYLPHLLAEAFLFSGRVEFHIGRDHGVVGRHEGS